MIDMVAELPIRQFHNLSVYMYMSFPAVPNSYASHGINASPLFRSIPFVFTQPAIVIRVNDCIFALCERNAPKGIAVANPPIPDH